MASAFDRINSNRKEVAEKVIKMMEEGKFITDPSWNSFSMRPRNPVSGFSYRGGNKVRLMTAAIENEYKDPRWMTYKQAADNGYQVKKDSKGVLCEKWIFHKTVKEINPVTGVKEEVRIPLTQPRANYFYVFNAEQIEGVPELVHKELTDKETLNVVDRMIRSSECKIIESAQDKACYIPAKDKIALPLRQSFKNETAFASVCFHEMSHSTGHSSRLNRGMFSADEYSATYAKEELRAELGALFTEKDLDLDLSAEHYEDHANYLNHYIKLFKDDPNELFRACVDADKIGDLLMENYEKQLEMEKDFELENKVPEEIGRSSKPIVINALAGPGAGKTTSALSLVAELKKNGINAEYVSEYAKELVYDEKFDLLDGTIEHENDIYNEKLHRLNRLDGKVDVIVTDSSLLQSVLYLNPEKCSASEIQEFSKNALKDFRSMNNLCYFVERGETFETAGRVHTEEQSTLIDQDIKNYLQENNIEYLTLSHEKINDVTKLVDTFKQEIEIFKEKDCELTFVYDECAEFNTLGKSFESKNIDDVIKKYGRGKKDGRVAAMRPGISAVVNDWKVQIYPGTKKDLKALPEEFRDNKKIQNAVDKCILFEKREAELSLKQKPLQMQELEIG